VAEEFIGMASHIDPTEAVVPVPSLVIAGEGHETWSAAATLSGTGIFPVISSFR
jgi:hypothetical protein